MTLVLVCGSRSWRDQRRIRTRLRELPRGTRILHGGARGADKMAGAVASSLGLDVLPPVKPNWRPGGIYNPQAGFERNTTMLEMKPDLVIAFWDGHSSGTKDTIDKALAWQIPVEVIGG